MITYRVRRTPQDYERFKVISYKKRLSEIKKCKDRNMKKVDLHDYVSELRFHLENTHTQGNNIILMSKYTGVYEGNDMTSQLSFSMNELSNYKLYRLITYGKGANLYATNNTYISNYRRSSEYVVSTDCLGLDIDFYNIPALKRMSAADVYTKIVTEVFKPISLFPSYAIDSGNGLYIFFLINPFKISEKDTQNRVLHKKVMSALLDITKQYGSDQSCTDLARVLRLPMTRNSKTGRIAHIIDYNEVINNQLIHYDIYDIADKMHIPKEEKIKQNSKPTERNKRISSPRPITNKSYNFTLNSLGQNRVYDLMLWLKNRNYDIVGYRNIFFLLLSQSLLEYKTENEALDIAKSINGELLCPISEKQLCTTFYSAFKNRKKISDGKNQYFLYTNKKIIELLNISITELTKYKTIITPEIKYSRELTKRKKKRRNQLGNTSRRQAKLDKLEKIKQLNEEGKTQVEMASLLDVSKSLISKYVKELNEKCS